MWLKEPGSLANLTCIKDFSVNWISWSVCFSSFDYLTVVFFNGGQFNSNLWQLVFSQIVCYLEDRNFFKCYFTSRTIDVFCTKQILQYWLTILRKFWALPSENKQPKWFSRIFSCMLREIFHITRLTEHICLVSCSELFMSSNKEQFTGK